MDLERLSVELRPRANWEAVDLGATMVRAWWRPLFTAWLLVLLPTAIAALAFLGGWGLLLLWWVKPLFDRVILLVLSRAVFGDALRTREALVATPRLLRGFLLDALVLFRFDPSRSFHLATWQLEGLRGAPRRRRARLLDDGVDSVAVQLTAASVCLELGFLAALLSLAPMLTPDWMGVDWQGAWALWFEGEAPVWLTALVLAVPLLSFALLEPFYVAAGFALYLNRRTRLEGWDLEIAFRRLAARASRGEEARRAVEKRARTRRAAGGPTLLVAALLCSLAGPGPTAAQEPGAGPAPGESVEIGIAPPELTWEGPPARDPRRLIEQVLAGAEFDREVHVGGWELRDDLFGDASSDREPSALLTSLGEVLATLATAALWALAIALLVWLLLRGLRALGWVRLPKRAEKTSPPRTVAGLDISPESLPSDPAREAEAAWRDGRHAEALSLLYRASLATLVASDGVPLKESDTEDDCLEAARAMLTPERCAYLERLTRGWLSTAYAHRAPDDGAALPLFRDWTSFFGRAA